MRLTLKELFILKIALSHYMEEDNSCPIYTAEISELSDKVMQVLRDSRPIKVEDLDTECVSVEVDKDDQDDTR